MALGMAMGELSVTIPWFMKERIDMLDIIKMKNLCFAKDNVKNIKR